MFEQLKLILTDEYKREIRHFDDLKKEISKLEEAIKDNSAEKEYKKNIKDLKKKYNIFKRNSKKYKEEVNKVKLKYMEKLNNFEQTYDKFVELRREASNINVYGIKKKIEQLNNANSLEDMKLTEEQALKMIEEKVKGVKET